MMWLLLRRITFYRSEHCASSLSFGEAFSAAAVAFYFLSAAAPARLHRCMQAGAPSFMIALPLRSCLTTLPGDIPHPLPATIQIL